MATWVAREYRLPLTLNVAVQVLLMMLSLTVLDGGFIARVLGLAAVGYWAGILLILLRRRQRPSRSDLLFARVGLVLSLVVVIVAGAAMSLAAGVQF